MGGLEEAVVVRQLAHLAAGRLDQVLTPVTQVHAPQPGHAIENLVALGVIDIHPFRPLDNTRALLPKVLVISERMQIVAVIQGLPFGGRVGVGGNGTGGHTLTPVYCFARQHAGGEYPTLTPNVATKQ